MCTKMKYVTNRYLGKSILVSCGKCSSCLQQKANARALRIRNHNVNSDLCLFLTLTYDNRFVPYILRSDLHRAVTDDRYFDIPVHRDFSIHTYAGVSKVVRVGAPLSFVPSNHIHKPSYYFPPLRKKGDCTGIIYWPDVQNFMKRLRINLKRDLHYEEKITYYAVGEYGSSKKSWRPHFHLLVYFPKGSFETIRSVIVKSWSYGDMLKSNKRIQIAIDASGYVASYVNKSVSLPKVLETPDFRQKHSASLHFGCNSSAFQLNSILEKVERGDCSYSREVVKDGVPLLVNLPIPSYVINRFFPKFKGLSSLAPAQVVRGLRLPIYFWHLFGKSPSGLIAEEFQWSKDDYHRIVTRFRNCIDYYVKVTGRSADMYAEDYLKVWNARFNYVFKHSYDNYDVKNFYENLGDVVCGLVSAPTISLDDSFERNPNLRKDVVINDFNLSSLKCKVDNQRSLTSECLTQIYDDM